ncbi:Tyrosine-protein phosphatase 1 [Amphibalanus amphitrite]|uniref:Tyrosine-protein phosphatase 1 n=2 Tax=Amphibalanus amphitrite TaxID=1232801 RepID=A0A6A4WYS0_AMPAM|nr:Tyrosine-protein phosphatase 1 [Amphibalanus amphitrite]KAF0310460.1 Tyrosine-protein phosphatase 1 [Amphibalanus amphitrite]
MPMRIKSADDYSTWLEQYPNDCRLICLSKDLHKTMSNRPSFSSLSRQMRDMFDYLQRKLVLCQAELCPSYIPPETAADGSISHLEEKGFTANEGQRCPEGTGHTLMVPGSSFGQKEPARQGCPCGKTSTASIEPSIVSHQTVRASLKARKAPTPHQAATEHSSHSCPSSRQTSAKRRKRRAPTPPRSFSSKELDGDLDRGAASSQQHINKSNSEGSFLDRLPAAMVEKVTSTVITKGPHKLAPIITDGPLKPASVAPSERRLSITDGAVIARPETPPATEADDSASSDVDSGTADVMDDLPSPGTPELEEEEEEDGVREEDRHRVVISVTQDLTEIHGPLGCQEVPPVVVRLKPGDQGRYGFNVKGGAGSNIPVTVSKVAPRSAICCNGPRLSEGDQVSASSRATEGS